MLAGAFLSRKTKCERDLRISETILLCLSSFGNLLTFQLSLIIQYDCCLILHSKINNC